MSFDETRTAIEKKNVYIYAKLNILHTRRPTMVEKMVLQSVYDPYVWV